MGWYFYKGDLTAHVSNKELRSNPIHVIYTKTRLFEYSILLKRGFASPYISHRHNAESTYFQ